MLLSLPDLVEKLPRIMLFPIKAWKMLAFIPSLLALIARTMVGYVPSTQFLGCR
jgi:hypothetical protein